MAISLSDLKPETASNPPRILLYGPPGSGKTSLASEFPNPAMIRTEDGIPGNVSVMTFPIAETFNDVMEALGALYTEEHDRKTVIIDSVTELQRLVFAETCARGDEHGNAKSSIEAFGYGRGYIFAKKVMEEFISAINMLRRDKGLTIVLIAHSHVVRFDDPESASYDRWQIDLHKHLLGMVERDMDAILLIKSPIETESEERGLKGTRTIAKGKRVRLIHTTESPAYTAKNRYDLPPQVRFDLGKGYESMAEYFPTHEAHANKQKEAA